MYEYTITLNDISDEINLITMGPNVKNELDRMISVVEINMNNRW